MIYMTRIKDKKYINDIDVIYELNMWNKHLDALALDILETDGWTWFNYY